MSTASDSARTRTPRLGGTNAWLALLLLSMVLFGLNTGVATWQGSRLADASTKAADLQVLSQQLANQGREAVAGNAQAFTAFKATRSAIEEHMTTLQGRYGSEPGVSGPISTLAATWAPLGKSAGQLVASEPAVLTLAGNANNFVGAVPGLQAQLNEVVRAMSGSGAASAQIYSALQQVVVAGTMARRVTEMRAGGSSAAAAGDALARDITVFSQVLDALRNGNDELGIAAVRGPAAVAALEQSQQQWAAMKTDADAILASSRQLFAAQAAAASLTAGSTTMLNDSKALFNAFSSFGSASDTRLFPNFWIGVVSGALSLNPPVPELLDRCGVRRAFADRDHRLRHHLGAWPLARTGTALPDPGGVQQPQPAGDHAAAG